MADNRVKIHRWLYPLAALYGMGVAVRNSLFDWGLLRSRSFDVPVISVGNITVGGTGKTPHIEYLIRLLSPHFNVAVLSRGYKRKSHGFVLADANAGVSDIGDEPFQMKQKFPHIHVAVDVDRCHGIEQLCKPEVKPEVEVVLLDDAYQHRYVKPGVSILLVDYHRMIKDDALLPAGRLRESERGKQRADIVIVTKCPHGLKPIDYRDLIKKMGLYPYQHLYFSTLGYGNLVPLSVEEGRAVRPLASLEEDEKVLLLTGIASPRRIEEELKRYTPHVSLLSFPDHHDFTKGDMDNLRRCFEQLGEGKRVIITTEKDAARLKGHPWLDEPLRRCIYVLPVEVEILRNEQESFNEAIIGYVRANSRNSLLHKGADAHHA